MKFSIQHGIGNSYLHEQDFDTQHPKFQQSLERYCHETGSFATKIFAIQIFKQIKNFQQDYYKCDIVLPVHLSIYWGSDYAPTEFCGTCNLTFDYSLKAADPGYYENDLFGIEQTIANKIIAKYQAFGLLPR